MPTLEEVHLGLGSGEVTFDYDPELLDELADFRHVVFYRQGKPFGTFVILSKTPSKEGITVSGYGLGFWLGVDNDGPVISSREYIAGNDQVDNGDFETLNALGFPSGWEISEGSKWILSTLDRHAGTYSMRTTADMGKDDTLKAKSRPIPVGALVRASAWAKRPTGTIGRLRLRTVYEGRFDPPDLLASVDYTDWTNYSDTPGDISGVTADEFILGPCTQIQYIADPSFEDAFGEWVGNTTLDPDGQPRWSSISSLSTSYGTLNPRTGSLMMEAYGSGAAGDTPDRWLGPTFGPGVSPGERYRLSGYVIERSFTKGSAMLLLQPVGPVSTDNVQSPPIVASYFENTSPPAFALDWRQLQVEYDIPEGVTALQPYIYVNFETKADGTGTIYGTGFIFDDVTLTRIKGNVAKITSPEIDVIPERTYKLLVPLTGSWASGAAKGTIHAYVALKGTGRTDQAVVSSPIDVSQSDTQTVISIDVTPPSGYDTVQVTIVATDLLGGSVTVGRATLVDNDTSTYIVDKVIGPTGAGWTQYTQDSVAPAGTEKVHIELVAEASGNGWAVDDVEWHRRETVDVPTDIVDDLLRDPDTNDYLVNPGTINALGTLQYDRTFVNVTNRTALMTLLRGGLLNALREFRINADGTIDVGLDSELFAERAAFIFTEPDLLLLSLAEVQQSVEDRLTRVKVIGQALQQKAPKPDAVITGEASTAIPDAYDWNGNPVSRTRIVEDSAVDYTAYANARAQNELDNSTNGSQAINLDLSEWSAWGDFQVGDWLFVYKPEALLSDTDNPMRDKDGRRIYPARKRCLSRKLDMARGDGFEIKVRRPDGTLYDVDPSLVRWADTTRATLELGDVRVDFANDPQGPAAGVQFLRYRAQQAR